MGPQTCGFALPAISRGRQLLFVEGLLHSIECNFCASLAKFVLGISSLHELAIARLTVPSQIKEYVFHCLAGRNVVWRYISVDSVHLVGGH